MHIIIGIITAVAGLIWAINSLQNSGLDLNSLNPFTWARRRKWEKLRGTKPLHNIKQPIEAATVIIVGALKEIGEITTDQKNAVLNIFQTQLHLSESSSKEAFSSAAFMVKDAFNFHQSIKNILAAIIDSFSQDQAQSLIKIVEDVIQLDGKPNEAQLLILKSLNFEFKNMNKEIQKW
tara:strand:- start:8761 stop:9294 length:534 start_codon:yes stop_codon:yes gene_type:complete